MIQPSIGRVVWYHPLGSTEEQQPQAATITYVWSDTCVNLVTFDPNGNASGVPSVFLWQGPDYAPRPASGYAEWMPYQHAQAAKQA